MIKVCPNCHKSCYLYREILPNGKSIISCLGIDCNFKSEEFNHHKENNIPKNTVIPTIQKIKDEWR